MFVLPYPVWMEIANVLAPLLGGLIGNHLVAARATPAEPSRRLGDCPETDSSRISDTKKLVKIAIELAAHVCARHMLQIRENGGFLPFFATWHGGCKSPGMIAGWSGDRQGDEK